MDDDLLNLTQSIFEAIRKTKSQIDSKYSGKQLKGYALCTTDDVVGVYHVACTEDWVNERKKDYEEIGYISVEWEQSGDDAQFDLSNQLIQAHYSKNTDNFSNRRDARFECFVSALERARSERLFADHTHLSVGSTDPSDHLELLETRGIDRLNPAKLADELIDALGFHAYRGK